MSLNVSAALFRYDRIAEYEYLIFFFKQKTAYEMRISDWSSDVCSSDLSVDFRRGGDEMSRVATIGTVVERDRFGNEYRVGLLGIGQIGRASCRERVCQYV